MWSENQVREATRLWPPPSVVPALPLLVRFLPSWSVLVIVPGTEFVESTVPVCLFRSLIPHKLSFLGAQHFCHLAFRTFLSHAFEQPSPLLVDLARPWMLEGAPFWSRSSKGLSDHSSHCPVCQLQSGHPGRGEGGKGGTKGFLCWEQGVRAAA